MQEQLSLEGEGMTGKDMKRKAMAWRSRNIHAWSRMKEMAIEHAYQGKKFSIDQLVIEARYKMHIEGSDDGFKVNNTLRAPLARLLINECPSVAPYIETRSSKVDWY